MYPASTPHLNTFGCIIKLVEGKGRGVFATTPIPAQTTIDISPVLRFTGEEYEAHGKHTTLDRYTFKWREGHMALALGLGSIFNHSRQPNISYFLDFDSDCIKFTTTRQIAAAEELCILYDRNKLWFEDNSGEITSSILQEADDTVWNTLPRNPFDLHQSSEKRTEFITEGELPFVKVVMSDFQEEQDELETVNAWAVDIPDPTKTSELIRWLKESGLEDDRLKHTKHVRRWIEPESNTTKTALLLTSAEKPFPLVPDGLIPYIVPVPRYPARTMEQVKAKSAIWPVFYEAYGHKEQKEEAQRWTRSTIQWFHDAVSIIREEAKRVSSLGEFPIVSYIPPPLDNPNTPCFIAHDTRISSRHPLRHAVFNLIRKVGDSIPMSDYLKPAQSGQNYLLTSQTLFTTHEPCIACSMALLHSRVKEVVYLNPMPQTGGCGGTTCVPGLGGVNHRYKVWKWRKVPEGAGGIDVNIDA